MTETEIREMIKDIVNNGAEYEVQKCNRECGVSDDGLYCDCEYKRWVPYKLGDEVRKDSKYRKVGLWLVLNSESEVNKYVCIPRSEYERKCPFAKTYFTGTKEECEKWIVENSSWMYQNYGEEDWVTDDIDANEIRVSAIEDFVKELLSRVYKDAKEYDDSDDTLFTPDYVDLKNLENIIKKMGLEVTNGKVCNYS